ncbi:hypothetical protein JRO89_XS12G0248700 [Xanthoceras sorbifolium]|uniref:Uncharacterized protein n=1 Tax=Xanthoceras sorbifolium TaxID=99658 RepID=A0ABQ8HDM9_9ROSI|nr:hypothetical protein JRO89_XS12G0248700 [Xanthoceras sorbifolium]
MEKKNIHHLNRKDNKKVKGEKREAQKNKVPKAVKKRKKINGQSSQDKVEERELNQLDSHRDEATPPNKETALPVQKTGVTKQPPPPPPSNPLHNIPKDSEIYVAKRNEALRNYEILVELEKRLSPVFSKRPYVNN